MNPDLHLGIPVVDFEHEKIFEFLRELQAGPVTPSRIINALNDYTNRHFVVEEELMAAYNYPELAAHRRQHDVFRSKLDNLIKAMGNDEISRTRSIGEFLANWLVLHISTLDKQMAEFIVSRNAI